MPFEIAEDVAVLDAICGAEDATALADWLAGQSAAKIDVRQCTHLHGAVFQTLLEYRPSILGESADPFLAQWILPHITLPPEKNDEDNSDC